MKRLSARRLLAFLLLVMVSLTVAGPVLAQASESVRGTIRSDDEGHEGVEIIVRTAEGEEVGRAVTDEDGSFSLELPGPGQYEAEVDQETLPDDVELRFPERGPLEFEIRPGQSRPLAFPLGESTREEGTLVPRVLQILVEGIKFGLIIAMAAIGLSLIFGTTGLVNFAHGELVTFGALAGYFVNVTIGVHLVWATVAAVVLGAAFGALLDRGVWRPLRKRGTGLIAMLVISIGLSLLLRYLFLYQFGGRTRPYGQYAIQRAMDIGPVAIAPKSLVIIALSVATLVGVGLVLQFTRYGKAMRAVADNPDLAASSGIDVERIILLVWAFGGGLAALGGVFFGLSEQVSFQMGFQLLLLMFAGVVLGGLGTAYGALVGSFLIGVLVQTSTLVISSELKNVGALVVLILVLLVRPQGLLGRKERIG